MAFQSLDRLPPGEPIARWLRRIQIEACVARLNSTEAEGAIEPFLPKFLPDGHQADPASPWRPVPASAVDRKNVLVRVQSALKELPESHRNSILTPTISAASASPRARVSAVVNSPGLNRG